MRLCLVQLTQELDAVTAEVPGGSLQAYGDAIGSDPSVITDKLYALRQKLEELMQRRDAIEQQWRIVTHGP